jgi:asparagine synthase (glutamine-hydrolysing)
LVETLKAKNHVDFLYASTLFLSKEGLAKVHNHETEASIFDKNIAIKNGQRFGAYGVADIESYLEGDILTKVDRATMRVALEGREPFLDHKIIEFAMALPDHFKVRDGQTKWILRQILYKYVPKQMIERPKMGFGIPLDNWLSTILRQDLLAIAQDQSFFEAFRFNSVEVKKIIDTYLNNKGNSPSLVWYFYCLHKWYKRWL